MTNTELLAKIKVEIERLKGQLIRGACAAQIEMETNCKEEAYDEVLSFIDTLESEKPVPKLLEEAASRFATYTLPNGVSIEFIYEKLSFQEGAKWQKQEMLKAAVEGIFYPYDVERCLLKSSSFLPYGKRVRFIIVKEDEK